MFLLRGDIFKLSHKTGVAGLGNSIGQCDLTALFRRVTIEIGDLRAADIDGLWTLDCCRSVHTVAQHSKCRHDFERRSWSIGPLHSQWPAGVFGPICCSENVAVR